MTGLQKLIVGASRYNLRLERLKRIVINRAAQCTWCIDITIHTRDIRGINSCCAEAIHSLFHRVFMDIRNDQMCTFLIQIFAQMHRHIADTLNRYRLTLQQIGAKCFFGCCLDPSIYTPSRCR
ncbi:hypothetical protein D3C74_398680 [compost metagenome]